MQEKIFKAYDIRGKFPEEINPEVVFEISRTIPDILGPGKILVAYDIRHGSPELVEAVKEGLKNSGLKNKLEIIPVGLSTTPMFYFLVNHLQASGGIMATASHNPKEYNGLKVVGRKAKMISGLEIKEKVFSGSRLVNLDDKKIKKVDYSLNPRYLKIYIDFLKNFLEPQKPLKVVFDFFNGATTITSESLFKNQKNLECFFLNKKPDPDFKAHGPNPIAFGATSELSKKIKQKKADLGVAFDADGDRAVVLDNQGRILPAFVTARLLFESQDPPFIADELVFKSLMHTDFPKNKIVPSKVGTVNVKEKMEDKKAEIGAEFSGHFYFKKFFYADSGLLAAISVINKVSKLPHSLATFQNKLPKHKVKNKNIKLSKEKILKLEKVIVKNFKGKAKIEKREGITLDFGDRWINIRKSNTEPLLRLIAGAKTAKDCGKLIEKIERII